MPPRDVVSKQYGITFMKIRYLLLSCIFLPIHTKTQEFWEYVAEQALSDPTISERTLHTICSEASFSAWQSIMDLESLPETVEWDMIRDRVRSSGLIPADSTTKEYLENFLYGSSVLHRDKAETLNMRFLHNREELRASENAIRETVRALTLSLTWNVPSKITFALTFCVSLDFSIGP